MYTRLTAFIGASSEFYMTDANQRHLFKVAPGVMLANMLRMPSTFLAWV